ncbi:hypothetical protein [Streptomyces sp. NPDC088739]|uniref:hypothetical protein n=1 Tax=Streptomyces sp. NPDC088739 TaxID=3365882 RepID=UPI003827F313
MPNPSPIQTAAINALIDRAPGCHLLKMATSRALTRHGWVDRLAIPLHGTRLPEVMYRVTELGYAAVGRVRAAEDHPCREENARWVEVSLSPLTGAAVALVCGDCNVPHWAKALDGAYASASSVSPARVSALIAARGARTIGSWFAVQTTADDSSVAVDRVRAYVVPTER